MSEAKLTRQEEEEGKVFWSWIIQPLMTHLVIHCEILSKFFGFYRSVRRESALRWWIIKWVLSLGSTHSFGKSFLAGRASQRADPMTDLNFKIIFTLFFAIKCWCRNRFRHVKLKGHAGWIDERKVTRKCVQIACAHEELGCRTIDFLFKSMNMCFKIAIKRNNL